MTRKPSRVAIAALALLAAATASALAADLPQLGKSPTKDVVAAMTREEKVSLVVGAGMRRPGMSADRQGPVVGETAKGVPGAAGTTVPIQPARNPRDRRRRRPRRSPDPAEARGRHLAHVLLHGVPDRDAPRLVVGHGPRGARRPRHGQRDEGVRRRRAPRARPQHPPQPARGPELRVLLGGPSRVGPHGGGHGEGRAVAGGRDVGEALRRQRPRVEPQRRST